MDVDSQVLAHGEVREGGWSGAELYRGGKVGPLSTSRGATTIVDGDLVVDGVFFNARMTVVRGDLIARAIVTTDSYLLVLGDLRASVLIGEGENYGTFVGGDAVIDRVGLVGNHHFGIAGECSLSTLLEDEREGPGPVSAALREWGAMEGFASVTDDAARAGLALSPLPSHGPVRPRVELAQPAPQQQQGETPRQRMDGELAALEAWISAFSGNQRALLGALRDAWSERLVKRLGDPERDIDAFQRLLRKTIKSPKLRAERDAWLAQLREGVAQA